MLAAIRIRCGKSPVSICFTGASSSRNRAATAFAVASSAPLMMRTVEESTGILVVNDHVSV